MTNNTCADIDIDEPVKFLGATVLSFNSSIGWGSSSSTLSVDLIEDCENGDCFIIKDACLPDTGVGDVAFFKANTFEFNGIIQSYSASKNSSGLIYKVQLTDPRDLLQNATIITDTYQGPPPKAFNFFNVYAFLEKEDCFNTSTGFGFGAGKVSAQGMSVRTILDGLSKMEPIIYTPTGQELIIDFTTFPGFDSPEWYRIPGPSITILELLQNICDTYGYDFYVYLVAENNKNVIKIGTVDLKVLPDPNAVEDWILDKQGKATDLSTGEELRNDITRTILLGGKQHRHRTASRFVPFFGLDGEDPVIPYHYENINGLGNGNGFWILKDVSNIGIPELFNKQQISELDIRFSMSGFKAWYNWVFFHRAPGSFNDLLRFTYPKALANENFVNIITALQNAQQVNNIDPAQAANRAHRGQDNFTLARSNANKEREIVELEIVCAWLSSLGNTYYGKQYLAELDAAVCAVIKGNSFGVEAGEFKISAEPTNAGAWIEPTDIQKPLGIMNDEVLYFKNDDGRVSGFAKFNTTNTWSTISVENLSDEDYVIALDDNNQEALFVKFDVEEKIFILNNPIGSTIRPHILVKFANMVVQNLIPEEFNVPRSLLWQYASNHLNYLYPLNPNGNNLFIDRLHSKTIPVLEPAVVNQILNTKGSWGTSSLNDRGFFPAAVNPIACAIAMQSNILTYGPWGSRNFSWELPDFDCPRDDEPYGEYGGIEVINDPEMVPWNFGSTELMNNVGCELVGTSNIGLVKAESGSATFPGMPDVANLGSAIITNGPSLTAVNTTFGSSGITTSYEFKTFTPKFGKLSKLFIDRIKQQGKRRLENLKLIRSQMVEFSRLNKKISQISASRFNSGLGADARKASPTSILTGSTYDWYNIGQSDKSQITDVGLETFGSAINEMFYDYDKKAFITLDAIFSPVSISGDGGFPQYINVSEDEADRNHKSSPIHAQPPFYSGNCDIESVDSHDLYNLDIKNLYLNPLSNPDSIPHVEESKHKGHSIDVVGRGEELSPSGLMSSFYDIDEPNKYSDDYRFLGLKGPLVLQSWGYDVDGKPIPNAADKYDDAKQGLFTKENLEDKFLEDWLQKSSTWPAGPVDLRFDRERGVWVSPQPYKIITARVIKKVDAFGDGVGSVINEYNSKKYGKPLYDKDGEEISAKDECESQSSEDSGDSEENKEWVLVNIEKCEQDSDSEQDSNSQESNTLDVITGVSLSLGSQGLKLNYQTAKIKILKIISTGSGSSSVATTSCGDSESDSNSESESESESDSFESSDSESESESESEPIKWSCIVEDGSCECVEDPEGIYTSYEDCAEGCFEQCATFTPTETPEPPEEETIAVIKLVDRIGRKHKVNDLVYAYYDTANSEYIILDNVSTISSPIMAYGFLLASDKLQVVGFNGGKNINTTQIEFTNPLGLAIPDLDRCPEPYAVVAYMDTSIN